MSWKRKLVGYILIGATAFGIGYGVKAAISEKKPDYSEIKVAKGFYQNADIELNKIVNENNELEIYLENEGVKIQLRDDLLLGNNRFVYDGLEKGLEKDPKSNENILDNMFQDAYNLKLLANQGNKVKEGCVSPSDIKIKFNETSEGDYLSIENKLTNENLPITKNSDFIQVGTFEYQYEYFKDLAIDKASDKYDSFIEKFKDIFPIIGGLIGWGS